ncbi:MAG TPA: YqaJ-like viral recombinase [Hyphomonadaceae bacterium]|nr:YqaJ-like viral recombinase [Hyphomonadaceae bacterium]
MKLIATPATLKIASNEKERKHLYELLAQRMTRHVEPSFIGEDMLRGYDDEITARDLYHKHCAPVREVGFITNNKWGFTLGYSPDGLIGEDGQIEIKSRKQKLHVQTIIEDVAAGGIPAEHALQVQTGLLVTERAWCDFISYSNGLPMAIVRAVPIPEVQERILAAAAEFEARLKLREADYRAALMTARTIPTVRKAYAEFAA